MEILAVVAGVVALALAGVVVWLARDRSVLARRASEGERAREELARVGGALEETERAHESARARVSEAEVELASLRERIDGMQRSHDERVASMERHHASTLEQERGARAEHERRLKQELAEAQERFRSVIEATAAKALESSSTQFFKLANEHFDKRSQAVDQLVRPIGDTLRKTDEKLLALEKQRREDHVSLREQVLSLVESSRSLDQRTDKLARALSRPEVRGRYGEVQLERVVELAGMTSYCDFDTQTSVRDTDGRLLRPDMVVRLPNGRVVAVDAKCNIDAYLEAVEAATPEEAEACLGRFAGHVAEQAKKLAGKQYWAQFEGSPEFVVMFIPGDQFVDAALERRPDLLDMAAEHGVLLASPSTLIGLLRAVAVGWREKALSDSARELFELGRELHERASVAMGHAADVGGAIRTAAERYNRFVGSVDHRLMPTLRKFEEKGAKSSRELEGLSEVEGSVREVKSLPERGGGEGPEEDENALYGESAG